MITVHWQHANGDDWNEQFTNMEEAERLYKAVLSGAFACNFVLVELIVDGEVLESWEVGGEKL